MVVQLTVQNAAYDAKVMSTRKSRKALAFTIGGETVTHNGFPIEQSAGNSSAFVAGTHSWSRVLPFISVDTPAGNRRTARTVSGVSFDLRLGLCVR
jgi:hypothetical protein